MKFRIFFLIFAIPIVLLAGDLKDIFLNPPHEAKPRGYWIWPHGNFDYTSIQKELREFKEKGLGGVDIFDLGIRDNKNVIPAGPGFMSPEQVDGIAFTLAEAKSLGLKTGLIVSSSWNAGAAWTPPEQAMMNLVAWSDTVRGPVTYRKELPFPDIPAFFTKPYGKYKLHIPKDENGLPVYYEDVATFVFPLGTDGALQDVKQVEMIDGPDVSLDLPEGRWVVMRTVCTNFGQMLWVPSKNSNGLTMDHFSREATRTHFQTIIDRLEARCGPLANTALERLYLASYEANADVSWTPFMPEEFFKRNGYRIEPCLPALFGIIIKDKETTERFLYDFRKTVSDLFVENLYRTAREVCHKHGLKICSEAGGPGPPLHYVPTEDLKALGSVDVMRGEFWVERRSERLDEDGFNLLQVVKGIASAAHIYGHRIVEMEAFTSHINWQEGPSTFKPLADRAFCEGMNRVVYHTMSHNLPEAGLPGWSYGAGTHMSTNLTWWDMSGQLHAYIARCSALLQQGQFMADAVFYYGHEIPNFTKMKHIRPTLGFGYDYDDINTEVLLRADVRNGRLALPGGMSYAVLVLPDEDRMDLAVLKKIKYLLENGATIIGSRPKRVYGLARYREQEVELKMLADELWGQGDASELDKKIGAGRLVTGRPVREVLLDSGIGPDVEFFGGSYDSLDYIHRRTDHEDIYFIRNAKKTAVGIEARLRVHDVQPQLWDAVSGEIQPCGIFIREEQGVRLPLYLEPHGSVFVVCANDSAGPHIVGVHCDGKRLFPDSEMTEPVDMRATIQNDTLLFRTELPGRYELKLNDKRREAIVIKASDEMLIDGPWNVSFPHGWGAPAFQTFDSLYSWTESNEPGVRHFSGTATYRKTFHLPENPGDRLILDLGQVMEIARVYLNGHELGISSFVPHFFDVTDIARPGENYLVVNVANTWLNRLIADDLLPEQERLTHTNLTRGPTGATKWGEATPKPSGLLGPVRIISQQQIKIR